MSDFKERLNIEISELSEKIEKLENFIYNNNMFYTIDKVQQSLLIVQLEAMKTYLVCLGQRVYNL